MNGLKFLLLLDRYVHTAAVVVTSNVANIPLFNIMIMGYLLLNRKTVSYPHLGVNAGMNQREMAEFLGVDVSTITNWEKGKTEPSTSQLRKISEVSGIPMDYIFVPEKS